MLPSGNQSRWSDVAATSSRTIWQGRRDLGQPLLFVCLVFCVTPLSLFGQQSHWSFTPPQRSPLPGVRDTSWPQQPIDRYVLAELEARKLRPAKPADKETLLRRVTFGLTGLPPTVSEIEAFLSDASPYAFATVVERLLASPRYGEQWARHWLDIVRYSDTLGGTANFPFANAYRYRDYVIRAFNKDKPFDRFVQELVAGDLLPAGNTEVEADRLTGPGALLLGPSILNDKVDAAADQIGMLTRGLLALDISCARCHDHPFEPLPTKDFYALAGIFTSTQSKRFERNVLMPSGQKISVLSVKEGTIANLRIHHQGNKTNLGGEVPRGLPGIFAGDKPIRLGPKQSGRLQLAHWLTHDKHPLTARVIVNRVWQRHFGVGLVANPDNFGMSAAAGPSNQPLLDWLALRLVEQKWSLKAMHRAILLSATYQQSSAIVDSSANPSRVSAGSRDPRKVDPLNRLLWRQNRRRLEAEEIRDSLLFISGRLDPTTGGSLLAKLGFGNSAELKKGGRLKRVVDSYGGIMQRSIYRPVIRTEMHVAELLNTFDFPGRDQASGRRPTSTNAVQSLLLMNSPFVIDQARRTAKSLLADENSDDPARIRRLYQIVLGRAADSEETAAALKYLKTWHHQLRRVTDSAARRAQTWQILCQALFMLNEFVYVD